MALEPNHVRAITLRLSGHTLREMAERLEVDPATICRWLAREDVRTALHEAQQDAIAAGRGLLRAAYSAAAKTLHELLEDDDPAIRIRAATEIMDRVPVPPEEHAVVEVPGTTGDPWTSNAR